MGAIIDLGNCLDFTDSRYLNLLPDAYAGLKALMESIKTPMPENKKVSPDSEDFLLRKLDCAVIEILHQMNKQQGKTPYDSVRGVFWEGAEMYPNSSFRINNHIQVSVRNPNCIKGYFIPRKSDSTFCIP